MILIYARVLECVDIICVECEFNAEQIRPLNVHTVLSGVKIICRRGFSSGSATLAWTIARIEDGR